MLSTRLRGARTHNLQAVDLDLTPGEVTVLTGVSGAGKSSLAIDTLYAEGQRRFVESFSPYARQFLERLPRPPLDSLEPVPAGVAVDRRAPIKSSRSTVATMADVEAYLTALFASEAWPYCPEHQVPALRLDDEAAARRVRSELDGERVVVRYPLRIESKEHYLNVREELEREGYRRVWLAEQVRSIEDVPPSEAVEATDLGVVLDRLKVGSDSHARLVDAVRLAWSRGSGQALVDGAQCIKLQDGYACPRCERALEPAPHRLFSYESPVGACSECRGFGRTIGVDLDKVIPDPTRSLKKHAIKAWAGKSGAPERRRMLKTCAELGIPTDVAWASLTEAHRAVVLHGHKSTRYKGVLGWFKRLERKTYKMHVRVFLARYRSYERCTTCEGARLNARALSYRVAERNLGQWHALEIGEAHDRLTEFKPTTGQGKVAHAELLRRLSYLRRVGLAYLRLDRQARTLSGGEAQRLTLTQALSTSLHGALFVLDEPSVGLHPVDLEPLIEMIRQLAERQNTVVVIEHDPQIIRAADRVVELGPGAGRQGGRIVRQGSAREVARLKGPTQRALRALRIDATLEPRAPDGFIRIQGATHNNLQDVEVDVPLGVLCAVTGVSGSGKSTLVSDVLYRSLARRFGDFAVARPGSVRSVDISGTLKRVVLVDQQPLGRTSRGNAATYSKAMSRIRTLFAATAEARLHGLTASAFSFNVDGGRCEACRGEGAETIEMQFLADVVVPCASCGGRRFQQHVLSVTYRGLSIADVLELTAADALEHFRGDAEILRTLGPLSRLGLGYLQLGQSLSTLSGGEAQRLKLARALTGRHKGTLLVLDEPSAGLHADEIDRVLECAHMICRAGGSVVVVEHDLSLIARADWVIEMGPGAGERGGQVVATGTPATIRTTDTATGRAMLRAESAAPRRKRPGHRPVSAAVRVRKAAEHNLKRVDVDVPHGALTVVTGPSGSGKSSLAFDVIFAEGQRRFLETLTPYARQFLPVMRRPVVESVAGIPPSIALEQRTARAGGRSTVATVTEVAHYLRLLFAKLGVAHCPDHDVPLARMTVADIAVEIRRVRSRVELLAPRIRARKGLHLDVFNAAARGGVALAWCDGERVDTDNPPKLARSREHTIDLIMGQLAPGKAHTDADIERAVRWGSGTVKLRTANGKEQLLSVAGSCSTCGITAPSLDPRYFSFNTRQGKCETCDGEGIVGERRCRDCGGQRLARVPRSVRFAGVRYGELQAMDVAALRRWAAKVRLPSDAKPVGEPIFTELCRRLSFLSDVGLDYLQLSRPARTLSGGEMQRLRLSAQLGCGLTGALYVLDEPTIGLHPSDTHRLLTSLRALVNIGSTVLIVEHDADTIRAADHLIDLGPTGGEHGGEVVASGSPKAVLASAQGPTAVAFRRRRSPRESLPVGKSVPLIALTGVSEHNLRSVDVEFPIARLNVVAGVSGSGKSTLVRSVLLPAVRSALGLKSDRPGDHTALAGTEPIRRALAVDQSPIGRTPRSTPATFLGIFSDIRKVFAALPRAKVEGFGASHFSFNAKSGGRCEVCSGFGFVTHEMSFLPDVVNPCPACDAMRFGSRTLAIQFRGHSIGDVLQMSCESATQLFEHHPRIARPLQTLVELGAGYIRLGQGSHTLSGGEAQRLKLSAELTAGARHEPTLYVLDEPTTGLHQSDVGKLIAVLGRLVERGDTLVVVEHHPDVIAFADHVVELGPGGGRDGGRVVFAGTPAALARRKTRTGPVVRAVFSAVE